VSFLLYIAGFLIVIGGLIYGAVLVHLPLRWIVVGAVVLLGGGILTGVKATRQKDPGRIGSRCLASKWLPGIFHVMSLCSGGYEPG